MENIHYNLIVRLLNDRFGIQVRGGWSCASTYAHHLFGISPKESEKIIQGILDRDLTDKPGWVRLSLHPTMSTAELLFICGAVAEIAAYHQQWQQDYRYNAQNNEFESLLEEESLLEHVKEWFVLE